uniref:Uncharacterized protein n=1 Tax=Ixodes ricinus TaxID=34613 RepID=A0A6B0U9K9_IXORI
MDLFFFFFSLNFAMWLDFLLPLFDGYYCPFPVPFRILPKVRNVKTCKDIDFRLKVRRPLLVLLLFWDFLCFCGESAATADIFLLS